MPVRPERQAASPARRRPMADDGATSFAAGLFDGKQAVVTGGTSGIGAATAALLARLGAQVIAIGPRVGDAATAVHPNIRTEDLAPGERQATAAQLDALPALDMLVNAASLCLERDEYEAAQFDRVMDINLGDTMHACSRALPALARREGVVVNLASVYSGFGRADSPAYAASQGALVQLTRSLAQAYAAVGVRVNAVAPGAIRSAASPGRRTDDAAKRRLLARTPLARWGEPHEVASVIAFLCTPAARFMTGAVVPVDGGYHAV